jgi:hypothetical protein
MIMKITMYVPMLIVASSVILPVSCSVHNTATRSHPGGRSDGTNTEAPPAADGGQPAPGKKDQTANQQPEGTITSGGGYIFGYEANPWFVGNTKVVKYCVEIDRVNFGLEQSKVEIAISEAISSWKKAFATNPFSHSEVLPANILVLGTQDFVQVDCANDDVDLRFQFGVLSAAQTRLVGRPQDFVAFTKETSYDEAQMHGKGFIYVSPESGPLRPTVDDMAEHFWQFSDGLLLELALMHELGHVFGIPHGAAFPMSPTMCEELITNQTIQAMATGSQIVAIRSGTLRASFQKRLEDLFQSKSGVFKFGDTREFKEIFGFTFVDGENAGEIELEGTKVSIYSANYQVDFPYEHKRLRLLSEFELEGSSVHSLSFTSIRIPHGQQIMTLPNDHQEGDHYLGGSYTSMNLTQITYTGVTGFISNPLIPGKRTFIQVKTQSGLGWGESGGLSVSVVYDGRIKVLNSEF